MLDFGLAKLALAARAGDDTTRMTVNTDAGTVVGTAAYMSPEQTRGEELDSRTDVFSFGVVLYELTTGVLPFTGKTSAVLFDAILNREPLAATRLRPELPATLDGIIAKALEKDRNVRYQSAGELLVDLRRLKRDMESTGTLAGANRQPGRARPLWRLRGTTTAITVVVIVILLTAGWLVVNRRTDSVSATVDPMRPMPLTTLPGLERSPSFSPDGNQIAFSWDGDTGNEDIYVKLVGAGSPLRLTTSSAPDVHPAWSPDGLSIAFVRISEEEGGIFIIPALGGAERKIGFVKWEADWDSYGAGLSWSPDGRYLAFSDRSAPQDPVSLFIMSLDQSVRRKLTAPPPLSIGDLAPEISRDGRSVAFIRATSTGVSDIYRVPFAGGEPIRLTTGESWLRGVAWTPSDTALVFSSGGALDGSLWSMPAAGGKPKRLFVGGDTASNPTISSRANRLAFVEQTSVANIWQLDTPRRGQHIRPPTRLIASTRHDAGPHFSPDGKRIVFHSDRSGSMEILGIRRGRPQPPPMDVNWGAPHRHPAMGS